MAITEILAGQNFNTSVRKYDSDVITVTPDIDYTGWTLKYMVKNSYSDLDADAVLSITPQLITVGALKKIAITFTPEILQNIELGSYQHTLKVTSLNGQTATTLFMGILNITEAGVNYPVGG